jgi:hypothetical protein
MITRKCFSFDLILGSVFHDKVRVFQIEKFAIKFAG